MSIRCEKIVTVDVRIPPMPAYRAEYIVLRDCGIREVRRVARNNPGVFVFPFYTGAPEAVPSFSGFFFWGSRYMYVVAPYYVGNLSPMEAAISEIIERCLGGDAVEMKPLCTFHRHEERSMREPTITINGHTLTEEQAMTARVAIVHLLLEMKQPGVLGTDERGYTMRAEYIQRAQEIHFMMAGQPR